MQKTRAIIVRNRCKGKDRYKCDEAATHKSLRGYVFLGSIFSKPVLQLHLKPSCSLQNSHFTPTQSLSSHMLLLKCYTRSRPLTILLISSQYQQQFTQNSAALACQLFKVTSIRKAIKWNCYHTNFTIHWFIFNSSDYGIHKNIYNDKFQLICVGDGTSHNSQRQTAVTG